MEQFDKRKSDVEWGFSVVLLKNLNNDAAVLSDWKEEGAISRGQKG